MGMGRSHKHQLKLMAAFLLTQQFADCLHGLILCQGRISLMDSLLFWPQKHPGGGRHLLPQSLHHLSSTEIAGWAVCSYSPVRKHSADCIGEHAMHDDFYGFFRQAHVCELCSLFRGHADAHEPACHADGYAHAPDWRTAIAHNLTGRSPSLYPS